MVVTAQSVYEKYDSCKALTDEEVNFGAKYFRKLSDTLQELGPVFRLAAGEANRVAMGFERFKEARQQYNR